MVNAQEIGAMFGNAMTGNIGQTIVKTMFWLMIAIAIGVVFWVAYLMIVYKYNISVFNVTGSGSKDRRYAIGKRKWDKARIMRDGSWKLLLSRKSIEPLGSEHIYPGNKAYLYLIDGKLIPGRINCDEDIFAINPVPYSIRKKTELELQQLEQDFAKMDRWEANKYFIYMMVAAGLVLAFAGFTVWLAFKKTDQLVPALQGFGESLKNWQTIPGKG